MKTELPPLTDSELQEYSREHVAYEIAMFFHTTKLLENWSPALAEPLRMATIESFAMHTRNLIDFFYKEPRGSDVASIEFFAERALPVNFPQQSDELKSAKRRADKEVGHLTRERISGAPAEKAWPVAAIVADLGRTLDAFVGGASPEKLHESVKRIVSEHGPRMIRITKSLSDHTATTSSSSTVVTFRPF